MRNRFLLCALVGAVFVVTFSAAALDIPLKYQRHADEEQSFRPYGYCGLNKQTTKPAGEWKLPELVSKQPAYALATLGDREHLFVLDQQKKKDTFYNRIYFDANANRDLTDDPILDGEIQRNEGQPYVWVQFKKVDAQIVVDGKTLPYCFQPNVSCYFVDQDKDVTTENNWMNLNTTLGVSCSYTGQFDLNGQSYDVWLGDTNGNGRFDNRISEPSKSVDGPLYFRDDLVFLGTDAKFDYYNGLFLGDKLYLGGSLFDVQVSITEGKITLNPTAGELATLNLGAETERLMLRSKDGAHGIMAFRPGTSIKVPEGEYSLVGYEVFRNDAKGDRWRMNAAATADCPAVAARKDVAATLGFGEPYTAAVQIPEWMRNKLASGHEAEEVSLSFAIRGAGNEQATDLSRVSGANTDIPMSSKNPSRPQEPTYKIVKADGEMVTQGAFEYG